MNPALGTVKVAVEEEAELTAEEENEPPKTKNWLEEEAP